MLDERFLQNGTFAVGLLKTSLAGNTVAPRDIQGSVPTLNQTLNELDQPQTAMV